MSRQRGLVLEMDKGLAVVLTPDGQYRRIPAGRDWELGREVQFESTVVGPPARRRVAPAWLVAAAVVLLALVVPGALSVQSLFGGQALAAYVAVDINPSLELQVDARGTVLDAQAVNDDAVPLLQQLSLKGLALQQALQQITEKAIGAGYLSAANDNMVLITVTPGSAEKPVPEVVQQQVRASQQATAALLKDRGLPNQVESLAAPAEVREAARREGVPTGKLVVASEAARQGVVLTKDQLKNEPLTKALEQVGDEGVLEKALENVRKPKAKDDLVRAVDDFVMEMSHGKKDGKDQPPGQAKKDDPDGAETGSQEGEDRQGNAGQGKDDDNGSKDKRDKGNGKDDEAVAPDQQSRTGERGRDKKDAKGRSRGGQEGNSTLRENGDGSWDEQFRALLDRIFGGASGGSGDGQGVRSGDASGEDRPQSDD
ncbi:MAG: anti-sigma factor domain-containing protein [Bacillota bacterium]